MKSTQIVKLEFDFGDAGMKFYCPACGKCTMDAEQFAEKPCKHLAFAFLDEVGDFSYVSKKLTKASEKALESEDPVEALGKKLHKGTSVIFEITTGGMACGPTSSTAVLGFELA